LTIRNISESTGLKEREGVIEGIPQEIVREFRHPAVVYLNKILQPNTYAQEKVQLERQHKQAEEAISQRQLREGIYSRFL